MVTIEQVRAAATGGDWNLAVVERVLRMSQLLDACASHPQLRDVLALKGGTAINLLDGDLPRLSVDLDFNVVGSWEREQLSAIRPTINGALLAVSQRLALTAREVSSVHAGSAWRMTYEGVTGSDVVEVDLNFLYRVPLLPLRHVSVQVLDVIEVRDALTLAPPELAAGKLLALLDRMHVRDVWDAAMLARRDRIDDLAVRRCLYTYLAGARRPWRELLESEIRMSTADAERLLVPMLRARERPRDVAVWSDELVATVEAAIAALRVPTMGEIAFLDAVATQGVVDPSLMGIGQDDPMYSAIVRSPALAWKAHNVREHGSS